MFSELMRISFLFPELMIPDVKEAEEEGKQKSKQVNDDVEVCDNVEMILILNLLVCKGYFLQFFIEKLMTRLY